MPHNGAALFENLTGLVHPTVESTILRMQQEQDRLRTDIGKIPVPKPATISFPTLQFISQQLQANGQAPLNLTGLVGGIPTGPANTVLHGEGDGIQSAYSAVTEDDQFLSDVMTADVSTSAHGYCPKLPNDATKFLDGTGTYSTPGGGGGGAVFVDDEVPAGAIDGANVTYLLANTPTPAASLELYLNGLLQRRGTDYTLVTATITFVVAPATGDNLFAFYRTASGSINFADDEVPGGAIDGANVNFTLANSPAPGGSLMLFHNGILDRRGIDYLLAGNAVTYGIAPASGDNLYAFYRY